MIDRYVFDPNRFDGAPIFRLDVLRGSQLVTGEFVDRVFECGLTGLAPRLLWTDSDVIPAPE